MNQETEQFILDLLKDHNILTFATVREDGYPQATTVAYANDGLAIYFATGRDCQKVHNLRHCNKVSLTIDRDYADWQQIKGLSMGGIAEVLTDSKETQKAIACLENKFPELHGWISAEVLEDVVFVKITPQVISVLDYTKGFGHSELVHLPVAVA